MTWLRCTGAGEPGTSGRPAESAGSLAAAAYLGLEKGADEAGAAAHSERVSGPCHVLLSLS